MGTRRERVILDLQDDLTPGMVRAAASAGLLNRELNNLDGSAAHVQRPLGNAARETDRFGKASGTASRNVDGLDRSVRRADTSINQLTGRIRVFADAAAILGPSLVPIGGLATAAVAGLASQLGFAAIGAGSLIVAAQGVGDALKAMNAAALEPTAANLEKAQAAMDRLGPAAQTFVREFQALRPTLTMIRDASAAGWFPGLTEALDSLDRLGPRVASIFEAIGRTGGNLVAQGAAALAGPEWADFLRFVEANAPQALDELGRTVGNLTKGLANLWMAFDPTNDDFSAWLLRQSRAFEDWSEGLSQTQGFQEFVDYIRENGPRVADALGAVGSAVIEIVEAVAPLGGPSLKIIEVFVDAIAAIADSDLGTPIFAGVAALAALNRVLRVTAALQTKISGSTALSSGLASGGILGAGRSGIGGLRAANTELRNVGNNWRYLGASAALGEARQSKALTGIAKGTAVVGGLTLATSGAAEGIGLTNTASLALMGTMVGPWGTALGASIGLMLDAKSASDDWSDAVKRAQAALDSGDMDAKSQSLDDYRQQLERLKDTADTTGIGDFFDDLNSLQVWNEGGDIEEQIRAAEEGIRALQTVGSLTPGPLLRDMAFQFTDVAGQAEVAADEVNLFRRELTGLDTVLTRQGQWGAYQAAIDDATASIKENGRVLDQHTPKGRANAAALRDIAQSAMDYSKNLAGADRTEFLVKARRALIDAAKKAGGMTSETRALARQLGKLAGMNPQPKVTLLGIDSAEAAIGRLTRPRLVKITATTNANIADAKVNRWGGGYTGRGGKYDPAGVVHRDEVVIPKELVHRDRGLLKSRYGHLPGMDQLHTGGFAGYASGGKVGSLDFAGLPALNLATMNLGALNKALAASTKALDREKTQRDRVIDKMTSLRSSVSGKLTSDLFGATDPWSAGGGVSDALAILRGDTKSAKTLNSQIKVLQSKGLKGGALDALLANADAATVANFAGASAADIKRYQAAYNSRNAAVAAATRGASDAAYGRELVIANSELKQIDARVDRLIKVTQAEHNKDRKSKKRGAGTGRRSTRRG